MSSPMARSADPTSPVDDQLMRTKSMELAEGMRILLQLFPAAEGVFLIEENKPEAIAALKKACAGDDRLKVHAAKCKYPQGGERSIIQVIAGIDLKLGMLPADAAAWWITWRPFMPFTRLYASPHR